MVISGKEQPVPLDVSEEIVSLIYLFEKNSIVAVTRKKSFTIWVNNKKKGIFDYLSISTYDDGNIFLV